ncbi:hypothetical protein RF11_02409 [Thelohanellus kitauei]|uniref:Uncharacterized protein n=1 Tax=Thelohanellus kitauei TaxID=669202 RepID=A0A0C2NCH0_THEKT|nr:hypothetical protein RF11_02409 [Thelohanellus kitauei]
MSKRFELVVFDKNIYGIAMDPRNGHLYYHDKKSIIVLHTRIFTKMTIFRTDDVLILTSSGDVIWSFDVDERIQEISYCENLYYIFSRTKSFKVDSENKTEYLVNVCITAGSKITRNDENASF